MTFYQTPQALLLVAILTLSCGEPLLSVDSGWQEVGTLPPAYTSFIPTAVGPGGVYGPATNAETDIRQLLAYDGSSFTLEYSCAVLGDDITGIAFHDAVGFMGVSRRVPGETNEGTLLRYLNGAWNEVFRAPTYKTLAVVNTPDVDTCQLLCLKREGYYRYDVGTYRNGQLLISGSATAYRYAFSPGAERWYVFASSDEMDRGALLVSADGGATWSDEQITAPPPYTLTRVYGIAAAPQNLYIVTRVETAGIEYSAVLVRTGAPGESVYELSYLAYLGPGVRYLDAAAFRDDDHGLAYGLGATISFVAPTWVRDNTPNNFAFYSDVLADPRGGYWTCSYSGILYWHP